MLTIIRLSLRFRFLIAVAAAGLLLVGGERLTRMHSDVLPETSPTAVEVQTEALGLSGPEVESLVTVPMEHNLLAGVMGVVSVTSDSIPGLSAIDLHFAPGTDILHARQLVQERLTQAFALPNVSKPPVMLQPVSSTSRVMMIGLTSTSLSATELSVLARWTIAPKLLGLAGVANVSTFGQADQQLQVLVDPTRLAARGITLAQIIETAGNSQLVTPLSFLQGSTPGTGGFLEGPNQELTIRHLLPFGTPHDLGSVPIAGVKGAPLRLDSVTTVVQGHQPLIGDALVHGGSGLMLVVQKLPSASVPAVTSEVDRALAELRPGLAGVNIDASLFRPATYVHSAFANLGVGLIVAAVLLAIALLALFLGLRLACIGLLGVALPLLTATLVLEQLGYTFNALVALGLVMASGVVVGEAVRNTHNLMTWERAPHAGEDELPQAGDEPPAASGPQGYRELRGALGYATLALLLSVAPVFFATGLTARFLHPMVLAYALAAIASLAVALLVTPGLTMVLLSGAPREPREPREQALLRRFARAYRPLLGRALRTPPGVLVGACVVGLGAFVLLPWLGPPKQPAFQDRSLVVHWSAANGTSLSEMNRITARADDELAALPEVKDVGANLGRALTSDQIVNVNSGEIWVTLEPNADYGRALAAVRGVVEGTPGMRGVVSTYEGDSMAGVLAPASDTVLTRVYGQEYPTLARLADQVRGVMAGVGGVHNPQVQLPAQQPTIEVEVNVEAAERDGIKPGDVRREAGTLLSGLTVGNFFEQQKVFDVVVQGTQAAHSSLASVRNLLLDTENGGHVRLGEIARVSVNSDPTDIQHEGISRYVDVGAKVAGRSVGSARAAIANGLRRIVFPLEYHAELMGGSTDPATSHAALLSYALAAALGIFLLLQAALGSWSLALFVLLTLPLSLAGGAIVAFASGNADTLGAQAGLLAVLGIAMQQAIVLAARIRRLQDASGEPGSELVWREAAEGAATTVAAAAVAGLALTPFAVMGNVPGNELAHVAASVMLGGLASVTLLNLFLLPAACARLAPSAPPEALEDAGELDWTEALTNPTREVQEHA
jgi:Cu/Ag efflux pump CusA